MCKYHKTKYLANMCLHIVVFNESRLKKNELKRRGWKQRRKIQKQKKRYLGRQSQKKIFKRDKERNRVIQRKKRLQQNDKKN